MENRREEFLKTVCQIYMAAVLVVLPLYYIPGNGYDKLGDSKYYLYRNISDLYGDLSGGTDHRCGKKLPDGKQQ